MAIALLTTCEDNTPKPTPDPDPNPTEQTYKLTYDAESSLEGKKLKDGKAYFIADGSKDTLFSNLNDGQATINITTEDEGIGGKAGVKKIPGHKEAHENIYLEEDQTVYLTPEATKHKANLNLNTTYDEGTASNIKITINDNTTDTTNTEGELKIPWQRATDEYNLPISEQLRIHAESTPASNVTIDPKDYTKTLDENNEEWTLELDRSTYDHNWHGSVTSSKPGKTIKDGTDIGLVLDGNPGDTTWTATANQTYSLEQTLYDEETGYELVIKNAPGHDDNNTTGTSNGTNNDDITLQAQTYDATIPLHVESDGQAVQGATITHDEGTTTTGTEGNTTINDTNLETNQYNEPLTTYNQTITTNADGYEEEQTNIQYNHGENDTQTITLQPTTNEYWLHGNTNAPNTEAKGWKDGEAKFTATSNNGQYETNHETSTLDQLVLDSLVANADGYEKTKILNITMQPGGTQQDLNLEEESQSHDITIETYGPKTATPVTQGTITITTLKDGQTHTTPIDNDGITDITLTGPYETNDSIRINITNDQHYTTGTFALLRNGTTAIAGKIGSSIGIPEHINHDLETTIDDIDDATGVYATMFADSLQNNQDIMESINDPYTNHGVCTWTPLDNQGTLIETITMYNRTDDLNNGGQLPPERIQAQQEALEFYQDAARTTTGAGKTLYQTTYTEASGPTPDPTAHAIMKKDDDVNASNGRLYTGPNTFEAMSATTRMSNGDNMMKTELGEGFGINDTSSGNGAFAYTVDGEGQINDLSHAGEVVWNTAWTYQPADFKK